VKTNCAHIIKEKKTSKSYTADLMTIPYAIRMTKSQILDFVLLRPWCQLRIDNVSSITQHF